jgi:YcaO cyclodehydratase, ATP-ad Mg2+-binding
MTGAERIEVPIRWGAVEKIGPCWASGTNIGLRYETGDQWTPIVGFGIDRSRRMVPLKSLMEALECLAYHDARHNAQSRSGMAAHFDLSRAKVKAYLELVERDALLFHWLSETPGSPVSWQQYRRLTGDLSLIPESEAGTLRTVLLQAADPEVYVCLSVSRVPRRGCWHVGMGAERDLGEALAKSTREWLGLVNSHRVMGGSCPPSVFEDGQENIFSVHHTNSADPGISALLDHITSGREAPPAPGGKESLWGSTRFEQLKTRSPLHTVVVSDNPNLLPLYFTERFTLERARYLENPRLKQALPERFRFHSASQFLAHPLT